MVNLYTDDRLFDSDIFEDGFARHRIKGIFIINKEVKDILVENN